jgi:glycosyltransferase involved in cell wall biosynthesis
VVLTDDDKATYEKKFGARNVVKIPNPVTIAVDKPSPLKDKRFLAIGRFSREKGFDMLLDAWALTRCRHKGWRLRVVGSGVLESELASQIERLDIGGSVELTPTVSDVRNLYRTASVLVMSSRNEGMPLVLIEAMAMGLPIVSFDCEAGPRNVVVDGVTGKLVPPENVEALAAAMDNMSGDANLRSRMSAAALERSRLFSPDAIMEQWMDLLT